MKIGQIVHINEARNPNIQTGIITKKEKSRSCDEWWYEVLCNDSKNHVIPGSLLSRRPSMSSDKNKKKNIAMKIVHACIKRTHT